MVKNLNINKMKKISKFTSEEAINRSLDVERKELEK